MGKEDELAMLRALREAEMRYQDYMKACKEIDARDATIERVRAALNSRETAGDYGRLYSAIAAALGDE